MKVLIGIAIGIALVVFSGDIVPYVHKVSTTISELTEPGVKYYDLVDITDLGPKK